MANPKPLLIISDSISGPSGLARIARDIASGIHNNLSDVYRVATAGYGSPGSCKFEFTQYNLEGMRDWVLPTLPEIWHDFAGTEKGIVMFVWDPSRVSWFSNPQMFGDELLAEFPFLSTWLVKPPFEKWIYAPVDATGPHDMMTFPLMHTLLGFDRILAYGEFGEGVIRRTIGQEESEKRYLTHLPHGIDHEVFFELPQKACRKTFFMHTGAKLVTSYTEKPRMIADDEVLIGIVATNQTRKDWGLGIQTVALLKEMFQKKVRLWIHTDKMERNWSISSLLIDYGLVNDVVYTTGFIPDKTMAEAFSACDVTLGIGAGEGFGYPIFESLFCGTPCIHGDYGGAPQWMRHDSKLLVKPIAFHEEGLYNFARPIFNPEDWAVKTADILGTRVDHYNLLEWPNLWPRWEAWFREAAK